MFNKKNLFTYFMAISLSASAVFVQAITAADSDGHHTNGSNSGQPVIISIPPNATRVRNTNQIIIKLRFKDKRNYDQMKPFKDYLDRMFEFQRDSYSDTTDDSTRKVVLYGYFISIYQNTFEKLNRKNPQSLYKEYEGSELEKQLNVLFGQLGGFRRTAVEFKKQKKYDLTKFGSTDDGDDNKENEIRLANTNDSLEQKKKPIEIEVEVYYTYFWRWRLTMNISLLGIGAIIVLILGSIYYFKDFFLSNKKEKGSKAKNRKKVRRKINNK